MKNKFINSTQFSQIAQKVSFLYKNIWKEFTTCLLHGPRQTDKSESAIDIAIAISSDERDVIFINTESHAENYCDKIAGASNLYIFTPEFESPEDPTDYADIVIAGIEEAVKTTEVRTFVIDSVTRIAALSFGRNASAAHVMKRLVALQVRYKLSFLIVAHDSTKSTDRALLNLANSEIILEPESEVMPVATEEPSASSDMSNSIPRKQLSRRDRRMLRRSNITPKSHIV
ncbi:MAG: AAA family ATPase [Muribaculaceae bacterium]|nr:AAA family ATPase [Muribaculaceae bacterium]